ncbi:MAG: hypothetical protein MZW92_01185 [Comamonadaceae bacterium]|nr:hypothetical protein [Comamonadaceae bacterium]
MRDWLLAQGLTSPPLHWYVNYACRDDYGTDYAQTSAWAGRALLRLPRRRSDGCRRRHRADRARGQRLARAPSDAAPAAAAAQPTPWSAASRNGRRRCEWTCSCPLPGAPQRFVARAGDLGRAAVRPAPCAGRALPHDLIAGRRAASSTRPGWSPT